MRRRCDIAAAENPCSVFTLKRGWLTPDKTPDKGVRDKCRQDLSRGVAAAGHVRGKRRRDKDRRMAATSELPTLDDVYAARECIAGRLHRTPMLSSRTLSERVGAPVLFKAELFQRTGAFKPRGVLNKLATLTDEEKAHGVISISAGNHAQALAYASALEAIDALVVMWQPA